MGCRRLETNPPWDPASFFGTFLSCAKGFDQEVMSVPALLIHERADVVSVRAVLPLRPEFSLDYKVIVFIKIHLGGFHVCSGSGPSQPAWLIRKPQAAPPGLSLYRAVAVEVGSAALGERFLSR